MSDLCLLTASLLVQGKAPGWKLATPPTSFWAELFQRQDQTTRVCGASDHTSSKLNQAIPDRLRQPEFSRWATEISSYRTRLASLIDHSPNRTSNGASESTSASRPISGSQLYVQRLAALQAGQLYTRLPAESFQSVWERASRQPTYEDWLKLLRHETKAVTYGQGAERLTVLLGDSHALWFPAEQLSRDRFWLNQGISGDTTAGVLKRLSMLDRTNPDAIYLMVGINDLRQGVDNQTIVSNLEQIIRRLQDTHPYTRVYIHSVLPTRLENIPVERLRQLNDSILALTRQQGAYFVNLQPSFADANGHLQSQLTTDGLHLNANGYRLWQIAISLLS
jgi:lysophospholipase L1-like esterase